MMLFLSKEALTLVPKALEGTLAVKGLTIMDAGNQLALVVQISGATAHLGDGPHPLAFVV